ncbi:hypothetical protein HAX42_09215 [Enterococcus casseliflavus]|nr:hypothetical protein [Enterococcus casseliflavus]
MDREENNHNTITNYNNREQAVERLLNETSILMDVSLETQLEFSDYSDTMDLFDQVINNFDQVITEIENELPSIEVNHELTRNPLQFIAESIVSRANSFFLNSNMSSDTHPSQNTEILLEKKRQFKELISKELAKNETVGISNRQLNKISELPLQDQVRLKERLESYRQKRLQNFVPIEQNSFEEQGLRAKLFAEALANRKFNEAIKPFREKLNQAIDLKISKEKYNTTPLEK